MKMLSMNPIHLVAFTILLFFNDNVSADEKKELTDFGQDFARWCRQLLDAKNSNWNTLLPLYDGPKVFNKIPEVLKAEVEHGVRRALDALYRIRDGLVTDENIQRMVKQWEVVDVMENSVREESKSSDELSTANDAVDNKGGDWLDNVQKMGDAEELRRQKGREKAAKKAERMFPFNPNDKLYDNGGLPWEKDIDGKALTLDEAKYELKYMLEAVANFLDAKSKKLGRVDFEEIVKAKGLLSEGEKGRIVDNAVRGLKKSGSFKARMANAPLDNVELLKLQFSTILAKLKSGGNKRLAPQGNRQMPPEEGEDEKKSKRRKGSPGKKRKGDKENVRPEEEEGEGKWGDNELVQKCQWIMQVLRAKGENTIGQIENGLRQKMPAGKTLHRTADDALKKPTASAATIMGRKFGSRKIVE